MVDLKASAHLRGHYTGVIGHRYQVNLPFAGALQIKGKRGTLSRSIAREDLMWLVRRDLRKSGSGMTNPMVFCQTLS